MGVSVDITTVVICRHDTRYSQTPEQMLSTETTNVIRRHQGCHYQLTLGLSVSTTGW
ncbi:hypothetical protein J6590_084870 [Homalodisca vitripennis]|nr:hypothetical protein J6590_084870 [Homalodisca vitripennis]